MLLPATWRYDEKSTHGELFEITTAPAAEDGVRRPYLPGPRGAGQTTVMLLPGTAEAFLPSKQLHAFS
jgi:hypothetical protein